MEPFLQGPCSSTVSLRLFVGGEEIQLAKIGPERMVLREPRIIPAGEAQLEILINGQGERKKVLIVDTEKTSPKEIWYTQCRQRRK